MKDLISVIIPVYNIENYLDKCLESIVNQTYRNLEIIIVDDGSTDNSGIICDKWAKMDTRIKVYHKKNGGISNTRNYGLKKVTGKYLFFVDGDDFVDLDIVEFLYNSLTYNKCDISTCTFLNVINNNFFKDTSNISYLCNNEKALEYLLYQKNCTNSLCGKLYKKELFNEIIFEESEIFEDFSTTYLLFAKSKKIIINTIKKYYYVKRNNSIMNSKFNKSRMIGLKIAAYETSFIKKNFPNIIKSAINREFMEGIYILIHMPLKGYKKEFQEVKKIVKKNRKIVLFDKNSTKISRIYALFSYFGLKNLIILHKIFYFIKTKGEVCKI